MPCFRTKYADKSWVYDRVKYRKILIGFHVTQIGTYFLPFNECLPFYAKYVRRYRTHLRKMIRTICEVSCVVSCFSQSHSIDVFSDRCQGLMSSLYLYGWEERSICCHSIYFLLVVSFSFGCQKSKKFKALHTDNSVKMTTFFSREAYTGFRKCFT